MYFYWRTVVAVGSNLFVSKFGAKNPKPKDDGPIQMDLDATELFDKAAEKE